MYTCLMVANLVISSFSFSRSSSLWFFLCHLDPATVVGILPVILTRCGIEHLELISALFF
ncbi:hypothetical protein X975_13136, partial [Stegodyphus mimosarum]